MCKISLALLTTAALGLAATAHADFLWDWSYTGVINIGGSPYVSGSGTLTTVPLSGGAYAITGITGTFAGSTITGLDASVSFFGVPDQTLYTPGSNGYDNNILSFNGIGFDISGDVVDIFDYPFFPPAPYLAADNQETFVNLGDFTATPEAAPEPSQVISMLSMAGLGGAGMLLKLRRRK